MSGLGETLMSNIGGQVIVGAGAAAKGLVGVTILVTGPGGFSKTIKSGVGGSFSLVVPRGQTYQFAFSHANYDFPAPVSLAATAATNRLAARVVATPRAAAVRFPVSGTVKNASGAALAGVKVSATGAESSDATTDADGKYSLSLKAGAYTLKLSRSGYSFSPDSKSVTVAAAALTGVDFTTTPTATTTPDGKFLGFLPAQLFGFPTPVVLVVGLVAFSMFGKK